MDEPTFKALMGEAEAMKVTHTRPEYVAGYMHGLRATFHGSRWTGKPPPERRAETHAGYLDGLSGKRPIWE